MNINQVTGICFSPTKTTERVVELMLEQIHGARASLNLTDWVKNRPDYHFLENEAVIVGVPVYGGRIPSTAAERLRRLHGRGTPAVAVVSYGNRAYEDALAELKDILTEQGFLVTAAAAVVTEHNIARGIAVGRPDDRDRDAVAGFAQQAEERIRAAAGSFRLPVVSVPGSHPYRAYGTLPLQIKVGSSCNSCGLCIRKCPVQAISRTDSRVTDKERCIGCMRCVRVCPQQSRKLGMLMQLAVNTRLKKACADRKEAEFFL